MENKETTSETDKIDEVKSPGKPNDVTETKEIVQEESNEPDATETSVNKPTQNGETETEKHENTEENDKTTKPEITALIENNMDSNEKSVKGTRGAKRKATEIDKDECTTENAESEIVEQKENVGSKNDVNVQEESQSKDDSSMKSVPESLGMGKGKRARIPNKRYSDILLSPNRKTASHPKLPDVSTDSDEVSIKEEPLDTSILSVSSPSLPKKQRSNAPKENLQDPKYLKPFKYGWKRELVWRSTSTATKPMGDIYYYTPNGKKVRSFRELSDHLTGKNLSLDNFSYTKEPLGVDDPEKEIIRDAKIKSSESFSESPVVKRVETVKKPKKVLSPKSGGAVPPKVEVTPAKRKVEPPKPKEALTPKETATPKEAPPPSASKKGTKMPLRKSKTPVAKKPKLTIKIEETPKKVETPLPPPPPVTRSSPSKTTSKPCQPCSIRCEGVQGIVPTLQCRLCLCLYHHECVGMSSTMNYPYVCKNCQEHGQTPNTPSNPIVAPPPLTPINTLKSVTTPHSTTLPKLQRIPRPDSSDPVPVLQPLQGIPTLVEGPKLSPALESVAPSQTNMPKLTPKPLQLQDAPVEGTKSLVGSVTSWLPHNVKIVNSEEPTEAPRPQYVEYLGGRKFLVIPKHNFMSVSSTNPPISRSEESIITPTALQPTAVPMASASLGPSNSSETSISENIPKTPEKPSSEPSESIPEIKKEPLSPVKAEENQSSLPMEVDDDKKPSDGVESAVQIKDDEEEMQVDPDEASAQNSVNKLKKRNLKLKSITNTNSSTTEEKSEAKFMENYLQNLSFGYNTLLYVFQYLKVQDLLRAGCVCTMWRDIASHPILWRTVRMKNSQVHSFEGLANTLKKHGTVHLDLRKMLLPSNGDEIWPEFSTAIAKVDTLKKIELCRCPASVVEQLATSNPTLEIINAVTIKCESMNLDPLKSLTNIRELRLKSTSGLNINSLDSLKELKTLKMLSLTSVNDLHKLDLTVIAELTRLESLDLGECTDFPKNFGQDILSKLESLEKLRLEKGQGNCHTFEILEAVKSMKKLEQLELVNFDVKAGFDKALGSCTNIKKLMIIPTYISQSATTNNMVLAGVLRLQGSLTHFVWGVTLELLRVTELFVDQCEDSNKKEKKPAGNGDSIPVLKPVPDLSHGGDIQAACNPPQVEILPLPNLQKLLLNSLPTTRVKILKIPFHATWRQTLTDSV